MKNPCIYSLKNIKFISTLVRIDKSLENICWKVHQIKGNCRSSILQMYIYVYVLTPISFIYYIYIYTYIYILYIHIYIYIIYTYIHTYIHTYTYIYIYLYVYIHMMKQELHNYILLQLWILFTSLNEMILSPHNQLCHKDLWSIYVYIPCAFSKIIFVGAAILL